ncbi:Rad52/Rad22 family DNA repair protein [Bauldia litoralis]|uniref:Rad52/Rad22 family DNA repair protein n=1 Tax=Bauldia litoralis TaxID=665467 RepID=UPI003D64DDC3
MTTIYAARVKITVRTEETGIVRDGHGTGEAHGDPAGEVHNRALKAAETDATKRALATFSNAFGLKLYEGGRRTARPAATDAAETATIRKPQRPSPDGPDLRISPAPSNLVGPSGFAAGANSPSVHRTDRGGAETEVSDKQKSEQLAPNDHRGSVADAPRSGTGKSPIASPLANRATSQHIEKAPLAFPEPHRLRDEDHLRLVGSQPCRLCSTTPSDAHHVRFS